MLIHFAGTARWQTIALAIASLAILLFWHKLTRRIPGSIVALLLSTAVVAAFHLPVETIGTKFGGIPQGFPTSLSRTSTPPTSSRSSPPPSP